MFRVQLIILLFLWYSHRINQIFLYKGTKQILSYFIRFELKCLFFSQLLHHGWAQTPIHRILTPWLCRVQYNRYFPQLSTWAVPSQYWSQPYSPPFFQRWLPIGWNVLHNGWDLKYSDLSLGGYKSNPPGPQASLLQRHPTMSVMLLTPRRLELWCLELWLADFSFHVWNFHIRW